MAKPPLPVRPWLDLGGEHRPTGPHLHSVEQPRKDIGIGGAETLSLGMIRERGDQHGADHLIVSIQKERTSDRLSSYRT